MIFTGINRMDIHCLNLMLKSMNNGIFSGSFQESCWKLAPLPCATLFGKVTSQDLCLGFYGKKSPRRPVFSVIYLKNTPDLPPQKVSYTKLIFLASSATQHITKYGIKCAGYQNLVFCETFEP